MFNPSPIVPPRFRLASRWWIVLITALVLTTPGGAQTFNGTFTADNAYELWSGTSTAVIERIGVAAENCLASEWRAAETLTGTLPDAATHLYLITFSDDGGGAGVLGSFAVDGVPGSTGDAGWEVFATGSPRDQTCENPSGAGAPVAAEINPQIAIANAGSGSSATTSRGWVDLQGGGTGRMAVGGANQAPAGPPVNEVIAGIDSKARWMWYAPPGVANPFTGGGDHREFLIFRLPLSVFEQCTARPPYRFEWYPLDETGPSTAQEIVLGRDGTWVGGPVPVPGRVAGALSFPGNTDYVESPDGGYPGNASGDLTLDLWVRTDPANGVSPLVDWRGNVDGPKGYHFFLFNGQPGFQLATGNGNATCGSVGSACSNWVADTARVDDGEWHFLAVSIDRDQSDGLRFYVDGDWVDTFNPTGRQGDLRTTAPLRLGYQAAAYPGGDFDGALDEVEILPAALSESALDAIYAAGGGGKCKESISVPWDAQLCNGATSASTSINICNRSGAEHAYDLSFTPLAPQSRPHHCDVPGPTDFTVQGGLPITVPANECRGVKVRIGRAPDLMQHGDVACYETAVRNLDTGSVQVAAGSIWDQRNRCSVACYPVETLQFGGRPVNTCFEVQSFNASGSFEYTIEVFDDAMESDTEVISLDGRPPGERAFGVVDIVPGERVRVEVGIEAVGEPASAFYDLVWSADTTGDGETDLVASSALSVSDQACVDGLGALCLNDDRFKVQVRWRDFSDISGTGEAVPLTSDTGYLWFFDDANVELMIKVLDGRALNDHWWVFYGALSNVAFEIQVTDTVTGAVKIFENGSGEFASVGDTEAFFDPLDPAAGFADRATTESLPGRLPMVIDREAFVSDGASKQGTCTVGTESLCLNQDRFRVEVDWVDFVGGTGRGRAVPLTDDTGIFWFFNAANLELVVKVLDGRVINGHFWVFYGALSNVEYRITVTDTATGEVSTYLNPLGEFASVGDTEAFED